ncbi:MAG: cysteine--tRNA ligase [Alphaproteobacteria bacterium]
MQPLYFYNTASRQKEEFKPITQGEVGLYCCGPTVYGHAHIGNLRTYIFEDVLRRTLTRYGYAVTHVMNITDVGHLQSDADDGEDKMAVASRREQKDPYAIARAYEELFFQDTAKLNILRPDYAPRATESIAEIISFVQTLENKGFAYVEDGNVYFDTAKYPAYADFARLNIEGQGSEGQRVESDHRKKNPQDFVLWFSQSKFPNQIMKWESPWGVGFPGWHVECSVMATKQLGERFDIHCGGIDHIPVHHTNEIAQSECCLGHDTASQRWVNYWLHGNFLTEADGQKMSKSKGGILTLGVLEEEGFDPLAYRFLCLQAHYRSQLFFSREALQAAANGLDNMRLRILHWLEEAKTAEPLAQKTQNPLALEYVRQFNESLCDDLGTAGALSVFYKAAADENLTPADKLSLAAEFDDVLGLSLAKTAKPDLTPEMQEIINLRLEARAAKNFAEADRLRGELQQMGIMIKDLAGGRYDYYAVPASQSSSVTQKKTPAPARSI